MEEVKIDGEYIELIRLLKFQNWVESGGVAKMVVDDGMVLVNGEVELRRRKKLRVGDVVFFEGMEAKIVE